MTTAYLEFGHMERSKLQTLSEAHIRAVLHRYISDAPVYLFGSRARNDANWNADYDLWVDADVPDGTLSAIQAALEESFVPFKVDIVTTAQLRGCFGERVRAEAKAWM